jgi:hypothetical protein
MIFGDLILKNTTVLIALAVVMAGCATRYVDRDVEKVEASDSIGDVVVYKSSEEFTNNPPVCLGVLPLKASQKAFEPTQDLRKAIHAYLAPTGIWLVPLQKIDSNFKAESETVNLKHVSSAVGCDTLLSGEIFDRQTRFWGVYSEVKIAAHIRITRVSTGAVIWRGKHTAVVRDGGMPLNPLSIIGGTISAGMNLRDEQITRTTHDLARRLVNAIPNLKYVESDSDVAQKPVVIPTNKSQSVHAYLTSIENYAPPELLTELHNALASEQWRDPGDRVVISEFLLKKDPKNTGAMFANATAKLDLSEPDAALSMSSRMLTMEKNNPEFLFLRGRALLQLNRPAESTEPFLKAVGVDRTKAIYPTALGLAYNQIGNHELALAALNLSLQIEPDRPYALLQQGVAFVGIGDESSAASALRKCMVLSIIANDQRTAARALTLFKAMGLTEQMSAEELSAFESKIDSLLKSQ